MDSLTRLQKALVELSPVIEPELNDITPAFARQHYRKKEFVFMCGNDADFLAFVDTGCFKYFTVDDQGEPGILWITTEGGWMGHPICRPWPCRGHLQAIENSELLILTRADCARLSSQSKGFNTCLIKLQEQQLIECERKMAWAHSLSAERRFQHVMEQQPELMLRLPRQDLAAYLGIRPQSLSRMQRRLMRQRSGKTKDAGPGNGRANRAMFRGSELRRA